jgi:protease-4
VAVRRGFGIVVVVVVAALLVSAGGLLALFLAVAREPAVPPHATLVLRVSGELSEGWPETMFGELLPMAHRPTVRGLADGLRKAKVDPRISSLLLLPGPIDSAYWAKVQEVRDAVLDFKRSGKPTVAFLEYASEREYYLASACERVFLVPSSPLDLKGLASYELFVRGTLDKIGAVPDMLHIGDYKTATNQLTEKGFTPAHREMAESLNRDMYEQFVRGIADARRKDEAEVRGLIDQGPFLPEDAVRLGFVDDLAYEDQIDDKVKLDGGDRARVDGDDYQKVRSSSLGLRTGPRIAVIYASGTIASGRAGYDPINGYIVGSQTLVQYIRTVRADPSIRAIVLRIDSPGGSSVASDVIWRELVLTRDAKPGRPLVVSMSDLAASGGYYLAMAAPTIVAQPGTLTGSIGIFGGKIVVGGTYQKIGVNIEPVSAGRHADMNSPTRPYAPEERTKLGEQLQAFYDQFVEKVAQSRHMTPERVDGIAQGRVWTGRQAKDIGLVDALGGLDRAIALAKQQAHIPANVEPSLVIYPPRPSFYDVLTGQFGATEQSGQARALVGLVRRAGLAPLAAPLLFRRGEPLALMPYVVF